ncbi:MAG: transposase [Ktedonobacteraceae bacterium]
MSAEQAERRRKSANREKEVKAKGVQRPNVRKRRPPDAKRTRTRKRKKTGKARLQLLDWTILITNVAHTVLTVDEVLVLARCRWQMEPCWKLWKQVGKVDPWRSAKPSRILTELYAKLLGCLITHWLTLLECWQAPNRSMVKARQVVQWMAPVLALGVAGVIP